MIRKVCVLAALAACGDDRPATSDAGQVTRELVVTPTRINNDLDLLFVLGNSSSTLENQMALTAAFPALLAQLSANGSLSLHIGGITPDLGTSTKSGAVGPDIPGSAGGCHGQGDNGALYRSGVTTGPTFLADVGGVTNFTGSLEANLQFVTSVGSTGCGFQQDLAAIRASFTNSANAGFRRADAALAIVILADKDECSALDPNLFSADAAALGPLSSFRCVQFGYTCSEADLTTPGPRTDCVPNAASTVIEDPADFVPLVRSQAVDPRRVAVGAIIGPSDVAIELRAPSGSMSQRPAVVHTCGGPPSNGSVSADPAMRLAWFANQFGNRGAIGSLCGDDLNPAMATMGINARRAMGDPCVELDVPLTDCTAVEEVDGIETPLAACQSPTQTDCYELATDAVSCPNAAHRKLVVHRSAAPPVGYDLLRCR